jgi:hypothetical protein
MILIYKNKEATINIDDVYNSRQYFSKLWLIAKSFKFRISSKTIGLSID